MDPIGKWEHSKTEFDLGASSSYFMFNVTVHFYNTIVTQFPKTVSKKKSFGLLEISSENLYTICCDSVFSAYM